MHHQLSLGLTNRVFNKYLEKFVTVFTDDILNYSKSEEEHAKQQRMALKVLRMEKLYAKFSKCKILAGRGSISWTRA